MTPTPTAPITASSRAAALAERLEAGARQLAAFATSLTPEQWRMAVPGDGRTFGVLVHHVATMYPIEIQLAQQVAGGAPVTGVSWDDVHGINANHAREHNDVTKEAALELLQRNAAAAAAAIRELSDGQLAAAAPISLYEGGAPLTCQFFLEDHAMRHSYHHLGKMRKALASG
jgi:hypothetical protein